MEEREAIPADAPATGSESEESQGTDSTPEPAAGAPVEEPPEPVPAVKDPPEPEPPQTEPPPEEPNREEPPPPEPPASESPAEQVIAEDLFLEEPSESSAVSAEDTQLKAVLEAIIYVADDPLSLAQIAGALEQPRERVEKLIHELMEEFEKPWHGVTIREVAGGFKMTTKPEHHEAVRSFVKSLKPPLKLSLPALETLAVIAYKQPVTGPEIMEIRGVQGAGVLKTLLDRKLIVVAGRKNVIGKPILYKTTKEFLVQFGLKDLSELPSLKEFEEIRRMAMSDTEPAPLAPAEPSTEPAPEAEPATAVDESGS